MTKKTTSAIITNLHRGTFFIVLLLLVIHALPRALGEGRQQTISQRSLHAPSKVDSATWTVTGSLNTARFLQTATLLPNGLVLVAGGLDNGFHATSSAELYDPASGSWTATGNLTIERYEHTATLLPDGKVLVAGGSDSTGNASPTAELYDPVTGTWTATGSLNTERTEHTATLLPNGLVLVAAGEGS